LTAPSRDPASFRDPGGHVFELGREIYRTVAPGRAPELEAVEATGLLGVLQACGRLVKTVDADPALLGAEGRGAARILHHERVPFISYPWEWTFSALRAAALFHLDLQLEALGRGVSLRDASAFNVQFDGARPVFIDVLSFRPYREGEYWTGHRQFCEQFLAPLVLGSLLGIRHNAWFRGSPEGIPAADVACLLPLRHRLSPALLTNLVLPSRLQRNARPARAKAAERVTRRGLPRMAYEGLLSQLRGRIARLRPPGGTEATVWGDYETAHGYEPGEHEKKRAAVAGFAGALRPGILWDLGCNTGEYAEVAIAGGAGRVVGFDADHGALERAWRRAEEKALPFLPLYQDAADPSPAQGWNGSERRSLSGRGPADSLLALALVHHLAIGRNVPLRDVLAWLVSLAPTGLVEFVPRNDPRVQEMLSLREDVFEDYSEAAFFDGLRSQARIVRTETVSATGRTLAWFDRT
jgi:ribosomal protein L11 methylase PrmA